MTNYIWLAQELKTSMTTFFSTSGFFMKQKYCFLRVCLKKNKTHNKKTAAVINVQATKSNWPIQRGRPGVLVKEQIDDASLHDP